MDVRGDQFFADGPLEHPLDPSDMLVFSVSAASRYPE